MIHIDDLATIFLAILMSAIILCASELSSSKLREMSDEFNRYNNSLGLESERILNLIKRADMGAESLLR